MKCQSCGRENFPWTSKYGKIELATKCGGCGAELFFLCPVCRGFHPNEVDFCQATGKILQALKDEAEALARVKEPIVKKHTQYLMTIDKKWDNFLYHDSPYCSLIMLCIIVVCVLVMRHYIPSLWGYVIGLTIGVGVDGFLLVVIYYIIVRTARIQVYRTTKRPRI